jgi:TonB-dependent SusC/RagA subfamily outer membrane receptor
MPRPLVCRGARFGRSEVEARRGTRVRDRRAACSWRRAVRTVMLPFPRAIRPPTPMASSSLRAVLSIPVLFGLAMGCASAPAPRTPSDNSTVTGADLERNPGEPIERVLQAKVPGVVVRRTDDGGIAVQIRGATSFDGTDAPLYLIDGGPFEPGPGGALTGVDPYSIESIKVLKGAEAGIYGIRGLNGVILIKMKTGASRTP